MFAHKYCPVESTCQRLIAVRDFEGDLAQFYRVTVD